MNNTNFVDSENHINKSSMIDEHQIIEIIEKNPILPKDIGRIVCGDSNSNILTFEISRFYDGVDLYNKNIKIIVKNELGTFTEDTVDVKYTDESLRFSWILSSSTTYKAGTVNAAIVFIGSESDEVYALKTLPFNLTVDNSLEFSTDEPPYKDWFIDIENELFELKKIILNSNNQDIEFHEHLNKNILDKLSVSDENNLLYDGKEIVNSKQPLSAYDVALENGFNGTEVEWLNSLKGEKGADGKDGASPTIHDVTIQLKSDTEFVNSLKGEKGDKGDPAEGTNWEVLDSIASVKDNVTEGKLVDSLVIKEVFQSVSNGKELIASAITDKGVETDARDTFSQMALNIERIQNENIIFDAIRVLKVNDIKMAIPEGLPKITTTQNRIMSEDAMVKSCAKIDISVTEGEAMENVL